ncbi:MAG: NADH-quinone oxidoreductase subunit C [SAR202 cluster bacterium]|nr:NADH-quinone oxidoreductase subunit C [SAR202 cluster bacterium]
MARELPGAAVAERIKQEHPAAVVDWSATDVWVKPDAVHAVASFLKTDQEMDFNYLVAVSAVDYVEYFEMVYHLRSLRKNHNAVLKTRLYGRNRPAVASVMDVWKGADLQEREVWDLMGIHFDGHPNMKRILLWEGFEGHPLRKDFLR